MILLSLLERKLAVHSSIDGPKMSFSNVVTELSLLSLPSIYRSDRSVTFITTRGVKSDSFVADEPAKVALQFWNLTLVPKWQS